MDQRVARPWTGAVVLRSSQTALWSLKIANQQHHMASSWWSLQTLDQEIGTGRIHDPNMVILELSFLNDRVFSISRSFTRQ
jgi:hypothetical protein